MAETDLNDIVRSAFPDHWQFVKIKKIVMDPSGSRWRVVYTAPRPMELDGGLLARGFEEKLEFLEGAVVERVHPEKLRRHLRAGGAAAKP